MRGGRPPRAPAPFRSHPPRSRLPIPRPAGFPLLARSPASPGPLERERRTLASAERSLRRFERVARAAAKERAGAFGPATEALFDLVAESDLLAAVVPGGRIPASFAARCLREARRRKVSLKAEAAALAASKRILRSPTRLAREAARLRAFAATYPGEPEEGVRPGRLALPGTGSGVDGRGRLLRRETIPGSSILLGPLVEAGAVASATARRLGRALALVDEAWPGAGAEIRARTRLVLTADEPGLVSYSHLHRPGVTYVNVRGKRIVDLADDLLHETAHHRLHEIEEATPLFLPDTEDEAARAWSPWRRAPRPVRGIYHAAYTFSFRAELFRRIALGASVRSARLNPTWLRSEAARERRQVHQALRDLSHPSRRSLLTLAGRSLVKAIRTATKTRVFP